MDLPSWIPSLIDIGVTVAATAIAFAAKVTSAYLAQKAEESTVNSLVFKVNTLAWLAISDVEQGIASELRAAAADGEITKEEGKRLKSEALRKVKEWLGLRGWREALRVFGGDREGTHDALGASVEAALLKARAGGALSRRR